MSENLPNANVVHHHKNDDNYSREITIVGINHSVFLKSNSKTDSIEKLIECGLNTIYSVKKIEMEENKNE